MREPGARTVTLDGQRFDPEDSGARLYPTFFCRNCGQEFHPVSLVDDNGTLRAIPRPIDEAPLEDADSEEEAGYIMPEPVEDPEYGFRGELIRFSRRAGGLSRRLAGDHPEWCALAQ
jgi:hypothetical protein